MIECVVQLLSRSWATFLLHLYLSRQKKYKSRLDIAPCLEALGMGYFLRTYLVLRRALSGVPSLPISQASFIAHQEKITSPCDSLFFPAQFS